MKPIASTAAGALSWCAMIGNENPTVHESIAFAQTALRTDDGTLLPKTIAPSTGDRQLIAALPKLINNDTAQDLRLGETIGQGGMGLVRVAEQLAFGRRVAVKTLRPEKVDPALVLFLLREAWVTGTLEHPNIVPIYSLGVDTDGRPMIVMKRIEGTPWSAHLEDPTKDLRWHLKIFTQVCNAIEFAGSRGIIHRDLKPDNVMIGSFGEVYVLDWGIAVSLGDDLGGRLTLAREVHGISGTPGYMAPEMVRENGDQLSIRTDVYLLGAVLHELITKEKRHRGPNLDSVLFSCIESKPYAYEAHVPAELASSANKATHRDPAERFATAGALRSAIEKFLEHESSRELTDRAEERLVLWDKIAIASKMPDPVTIQRLFGEAHFAFQQAIREWSENERARDGLMRCLERKFEHDLARDDFESAAVILEELGAQRLDLAQRLDALRARLAKRKAELIELRHLQDSRNLETGRRTRAFIMILCAFSFGLIPPFAQVLGYTGDRGYEYFYFTSALKLADALIVAWWARDSLSKTEVNRAFTGAMFMLIIAEICVRPFAQKLGHPVEHSLMVDFGIYFLVDATLGMAIDRRLLLCPVFYLAGALIGYASPGSVYWALGAAHFCSGLYTAFVWRPDTLLRQPIRKPVPALTQN